MERPTAKRRGSRLLKRAQLRPVLSILAFVVAVFAVIYLAFWHQDALAPGEQPDAGASDTPGAPPAR